MAKVQSARAQAIRAARAARNSNTCAKHGTKISVSALRYRCGCPTK